MQKTSILAPTLILAAVPAAFGASFKDAPILPDAGVDVFNRTVAREWVDRDLFSTPWATAIVGRVDVYERFPYLESRWFQIVSDPEWNRLLYGEVGGDLRAFTGHASVGELREPRGLASDEYGRVFVADSGNRRIVAFGTRSEYDRMELEPLFVIDDLERPYGVAFSDAGTPFDPGDDRLYVADTGGNRVVAYALDGNGATRAAEIGGLGSGVGRFAGPFAVTIGRRDGVGTDDVYVADSHNGRIVRLGDAGDRFEWRGEAGHAALVTALDTDHWGHVYATSPTAGVTKLTAGLAPLATLDEGVRRARGFHVPFVNRTDHRTGEVRRVGQGAGLLVEEWTGETGIRLVRLGVEIAELAVQVDDEIRASLVLTDRADVATEVLDAATGRIVHRHDWGARDAGDVALTLTPSELPDVLVNGEYIFRVTARPSYEGGEESRSQSHFTWEGGPVGRLPESPRVLGNEPNPFRAATTIRFSIPDGPARLHDLRVFDVAGRTVRVLGQGSIDPGLHALTWNGRDEHGRDVAAGIYFYQLVVGGEASTGKMVLLR